MANGEGGGRWEGRALSQGRGLTVAISHCYCVQCAPTDCVTQAWNAHNSSDSWNLMKSTCDRVIKPVSKAYSHKNKRHLPQARNLLQLFYFQVCLVSAVAWCNPLHSEKPWLQTGLLRAPFHNWPCQLDKPIISPVYSAHESTPTLPSHITVNVGVTQSNKLTTQVWYFP